MKIGVPPWTRGDFRGALGVTHNLVWVVDRGTHPGASRHPSEEGIFMPPGDATFDENVSFSSSVFGKIQAESTRTSTATRTIFKGVFMPRCGATFDENTIPP